LGFTLSQLLETTGIDSLSGNDLKKIAAKKGSNDLLKLAERCRTAATATPEERAVVDERGLVEKTAAVQIIRRTISEIREIEGTSPGAEKTAAEKSPSNQAAFIKAALEAGHDEESIAKFLEQPPTVDPGSPTRRAKKTATSIVG
jgi:hypothetical protein